MSWSICAYFHCNCVHGFLSVSGISIEGPAVLYRDQKFGLGPVYLKGWIKYVYLKKKVKQPPLGFLDNEGWGRRTKWECYQEETVKNSISRVKAGKISFSDEKCESIQRCLSGIFFPGWGMKDVLLIMPLRAGFQGWLCPTGSSFPPSAGDQWRLCEDRPETHHQILPWTSLSWGMIFFPQMDIVSQ